MADRLFQHCILITTNLVTLSAHTAIFQAENARIQFNVSSVFVLKVWAGLILIWFTAIRIRLSSKVPCINLTVGQMGNTVHFQVVIIKPSYSTVILAKINIQTMMFMNCWFVLSGSILLWNNKICFESAEPSTQPKYHLCFLGFCPRIIYSLVLVFM